MDNVTAALLFAFPGAQRPTFDAANTLVVSYGEKLLASYLTEVGLFRTTDRGMSDKDTLRETLNRLPSSGFANFLVTELTRMGVPISEDEVWALITLSPERKKASD